MENLSRKKLTKEENKKQENILNNFNGLFKNNDVIAQQLKDGANEIFSQNLQEVRKSQLKIYSDFVKNILGHDIEKKPEKDPFFKVAGVPITKVFLDKYELLKYNTQKENELTILANTLLLSGNFLFNDLDVFEGKDNTQIRAHFELFDPIVMNERKDWIMHFGFLNFRKQNENDSESAAQGVIIMEPEVLERISLIMNQAEQQLFQKKLQEIKNWFNHDLTAHGTYLPSRRLDKDILETDKIGDVKRFEKEFINEGYESAFTGELWSLNFHRTLFDEFVKERPAILRFIAKHAADYLSFVKEICNRIPNEQDQEDCFDYLKKVYAFCFFRLINPKQFASDEVFKSLYDRYPDFPDVGSNEEAIRDFIFSENGLYDSEQKKYIPHDVVFGNFVDSFNSFEKINGLLNSINNQLDSNQKIALSKENFSILLNYFKTHNYEMYSFFRLHIPDKEFRKEKNGITLHDLLYDSLNLEKNLKLLLEFPESKDNFFERAVKRDFGFKVLATGKKFSLEKDK